MNTNNLILIFYVYKSREYREWFLDSTYSRHRTRDESLFLRITKINGGKVTFGDNLKGKIIKGDNIKGTSFHLIRKTILINSLNHSYK